MHTDWPAVGVLAFSILSGGLAMAWRLGSLTQRVKSMEDALEPDTLLRDFRIDVDRRLSRLEAGQPPFASPLRR